MKQLGTVLEKQAEGEQVRFYSWVCSPLALGSQPRKMTARMLKQPPKGKTHKSKSNRPCRNAGDCDFGCRGEYASSLPGFASLNA